MDKNHCKAMHHILPRRTEEFLTHPMAMGHVRYWKCHVIIQALGSRQSSRAQERKASTVRFFRCMSRTRHLRAISHLVHVVAIERSPPRLAVVANLRHSAAAPKCRTTDRPLAFRLALHCPCRQLSDILPTLQLHCPPSPSPTSSRRPAKPPWVCCANSRWSKAPPKDWPCCAMRAKRLPRDAS